MRISLWYTVTEPSGGLFAGQQPAQTGQGGQRGGGDHDELEDGGQDALQLVHGFF